MQSVYSTAQADWDKSSFEEKFKVQERERERESEREREVLQYFGKIFFGKISVQ